MPVAVRSLASERSVLVEALLKKLRITCVQAPAVTLPERASVFCKKSAYTRYSKKPPRKLKRSPYLLCTAGSFRLISSVIAETVKITSAVSPPYSVSKVVASILLKNPPSFIGRGAVRPGLTVALIITDNRGRKQIFWQNTGILFFNASNHLHTAFSACKKSRFMVYC